MVETSKDILFLVIAFCFLLVSGFLVWMMYYLAMILKDAREVVYGVKKKVEALDEIFNMIKEKVTTSATLLTALAKGLAELVGVFRARREAKMEAEEEKKTKKGKR